MYVGFDTSNYTTSLALYNDCGITNYKKMLAVKEGERGLRQSDALFQHTVNLPALLEDCEFNGVNAVGVSDRPRNVDGSYMPCFLAGVSAATAFSKSCGAPLYRTSHQVGHILAALYSADKLELINDKFIAFHLSGGTTEALLVTPHEDEIIRAEIVGESLDLKAGQAIDRAGVMMGFQFPCGKILDELSQKSEKEYSIRPSMKGTDCSLSGVENKAKQMFLRNESKEDISKFVLSCVTSAVASMLGAVIQEHGEMPVIFSGGVSSNSMLRKLMASKYGAFFAQPEFSLDNAAGVAVFASLKNG